MKAKSSCCKSIICKFFRYFIVFHSDTKHHNCVFFLFLSFHLIKFSFHDVYREWIVRAIKKTANWLLSSSNVLTSRYLNSSHSTFHRQSARFHVETMSLLLYPASVCDVKQNKIIFLSLRVFLLFLIVFPSDKK